MEMGMGMGIVMGCFVLEVTRIEFIQLTATEIL